MSPFGPWDSFDDCISDMMGKQGYDEETAKKVCGALKAKLEGKSMNETLERRAFELTEVRAVKDKLRLEGHAAVFNCLSEDLGGFREQIMPGAFAQSIAEDDIMALWNHNPDYPLGRNRAGTLQLSEDTTGLAMVISLPDTQVGRDLMVSVERRDITGASFSFVVPQGGDKWDHMEAGDLRTLLFARLKDVSPVAFPAYQDTDVAIAKRSHDLWMSKEAWDTGHTDLKPYARLLRERKMKLTDRA